MLGEILLWISTTVAHRAAGGVMLATSKFDVVPCLQDSRDKTRLDGGRRHATTMIGGLPKR